VKWGGGASLFKHTGATETRMTKRPTRTTAPVLRGQHIPLGVDAI
jgi:hypothetical protein